MSIKRTGKDERGKSDPLGRKSSCTELLMGHKWLGVENGREIQSQIWKGQVIWFRLPLDRSGRGVWVDLFSHLDLASQTFSAFCLSPSLISSLQVVWYFSSCPRMKSFGVDLIRLGDGAFFFLEVCFRFRSFHWPHQQLKGRSPGHSLIPWAERKGF